MIDENVEKIVDELKKSQNIAGVEAVLKVALYYTEKIKNPGIKVVDKAIKKDSSVDKKTEPDKPLPVFDKAGDEDVDLQDALAEEEKKLGFSE